MKRICFRLFFLVFASTLPLTAQSELWSKASLLAAQSRDLLPGRLTTVAEELNSDGTRKSTLQMTMSMTYDSHGALERTEIVEAIRDGKDVTEEMRTDVQKAASQGKGTAGQGSTWVGFSGMLFDAESSKKIHFLPGASSVRKGDRTFSVIAFEMGVNLFAKLRGTAEIDPETGIPSIVRATGQVPFVKDLSLTMTYSPFASGGFVLSTLEFAGSVTIPFRKAGFWGSLAFSDYQRVSVSLLDR